MMLTELNHIQNQEANARRDAAILLQHLHLLEIAIDLGLDLAAGLAGSRLRSHVEVLADGREELARRLEVFIIWMLFYLACSLTISVVVNFFNVRLKIVER